MLILISLCVCSNWVHTIVFFKICLNHIYREHQWPYRFRIWQDPSIISFFFQVLVPIVLTDFFASSFGKQVFSMWLCGRSWWKNWRDSREKKTNIDQTSFSFLLFVPFWNYSLNLTTCITVTLKSCRKTCFALLSHLSEWFK